MHRDYELMSLTNKPAASLGLCLQQDDSSLSLRVLETLRFSALIHMKEATKVRMGSTCPSIYFQRSPLVSQGLGTDLNTHFQTA